LLDTDVDGKETGSEGVDWFQKDQDKVQRSVFVNTVMSPQVQLKWGGGDYKL